MTGRLYINGVLEDIEYNTMDDIYTLMGDYKTYIGKMDPESTARWASYGGTLYTFDGWIDDVLISTRCLSATEILSLYTRGRSTAY